MIPQVSNLNTITKVNHLDLAIQEQKKDNNFSTITIDPNFIENCIWKNVTPLKIDSLLIDDTKFLFGCAALALVSTMTLPITWTIGAVVIGGAASYLTNGGDGIAATKNLYEYRHVSQAVLLTVRMTESHRQLSRNVLSHRPDLADLWIGVLPPESALQALLEVS